jgi:hypothetical protein
MLLLAMLIACLLAGCGGGSEAPSANARRASSSEHPGKARREAAKRPATCKVGESILGFAPEGPVVWSEGKGPVLALACLHDRVATAVIVGYPSPEGKNAGYCVTSYRGGPSRAPSGQCAGAGVPSNWSCHGAQGCVAGFMYAAGLTGLGGPLTQKVAGVRVLVRGRPLKEGIAVARVRGETLQLIDAEEPFGFFLAFIPGCVPSGQVKVEFLDATGARMGLAHGWDTPFSCPKGA